MASDAPSTFSQSFGDLRTLSDWFVRVPAAIATGKPLSGNRTAHQQRLRRLGATAVPLLGRELCHVDPLRREAARDALALLATTPARHRVIDELHAVTTNVDAADESKVCALGLLAELGERGEARFSDPSAMQRRSALALAAQLDTPGDIAGAADFMVRQLDDDDIAEMMQVLVDAAPDAARTLAGELAIRLDVALDLRERIADAVAPIATSVTTATPTTAPPPRRAPRPTHVAVLVDAGARIVVVASRKIAGERRWRRWAVLIGATGRVEDCLHEDDATIDADATELIANLCADGYRVASNDLEHARTVVAAAARLTAGDPRSAIAQGALASAYYVGRDLLDLGDAHLGDRHHRTSADAATSLVARAIELLADGEPARARALLDALPAAAAAANADAAGARAACCHARASATSATTAGTDDELVAARDALDRAIALESTWPLHHWNLAVVLHRLGDANGSYEALVQFVATSASPTALHGDPDQPGRLACADKLIAEHERAARLLVPTGPRRRRRRTAKSPPRP